MAHLTILGAAYGLGDVTGKVRALQYPDKLIVTANNATFTNTWPNVTKTLVVVYQYDVPGHHPEVSIVEEGKEMQILPPENL